MTSSSSTRGVPASTSQTVVRTHWNHLAIVNMRNDLHANQRNLTEMVLLGVTNKRHTTKAMQLWEHNHREALERYDHIIHELGALRTLDFPAISVAVSEVRRLVANTQQVIVGAE